MIPALRALDRVLAFVLLAALAAAGAAAAVFSIQGDGGTLGLKHLGQILHLPQARDAVGTFLRSLEAGGPVAVLALACGAGAIVLGLALLSGLLVRPRPREISLESSGEGRIAARRRALAQAGAALAESADGVTEARSRARPRRGSGDGARLKVRATRNPTTPRDGVLAAVQDRLAPITDAWGLATRVRTRVAHGADRVE